MNRAENSAFAGHDHIFLGAGHEQNERKTWAVIALCGVMMIVEIVGGSLFGSLALVADGLHMSTHASAMLIAALAYRYARKRANDRRFVFGTGKLGDLAGFTSAVILAMIALLIGYEAIARFLAPVPIQFGEAIPIAVLGLLVNIVSAWLLSGGDHHGHAHHHGAGSAHDHAGPVRQISTPAGAFSVSIFEEGVPPVFRIEPVTPGMALSGQGVRATTVRPDGVRQVFEFSRRDEYLESTSIIPEPHAFDLVLQVADGEYALTFDEHEPHEHAPGIDARDHNIRAAYVHVMADAAVSVLAIIGLSLAKFFGWLWMDPLAGAVGALVIANWSYGLVRDTGAILLDMSPGDAMVSKVRATVEDAGDQLVDLHVWRLGPGHFGVIASVVGDVTQRGPDFYHAALRRIKGLSHITVEVHTGRTVA
ncbi:MAG: CDF family Co(II)/Ni(II) efflux transporter DmeF [Steroidobacterales bacterium]